MSEEQRCTTAMPPEVEAAFYEEEKRAMAAFIANVDRWPEYRLHLAYGLLGIAVATCDTFGGDVEGWLAKLRRQEPKPPVLVPPKAVQS